MQIQDIELKKLKPWEKNPRINDRAVDAVVKSITEFGFNVPILCDPKFTIIAGHTRWKAAKNLKLKTVPVVVLELTDAQRQAFSIADNKTAEIATWDFPQLSNILDELVKTEIDLPAAGFSQAELDVLLASSSMKDFDWSVFEEESLSTVDPDHIRLLVKVPPEIKDSMKQAIRDKAKTIGCSHHDHGVLAGLVFQKLLGGIDGRAS